MKCDFKECPLGVMRINITQSMVFKNRTEVDPLVHKALQSGVGSGRPEGVSQKLTGQF